MFQLFDFDLEVQPVLEVLVGKTVEQTLIEVLEEEELAALRAQQRRFLELQRLEEQDRRKVRAADVKCSDSRVHNVRKPARNMSIVVVWVYEAV
jgi:hypothetical protein